MQTILFLLAKSLLCRNVGIFFHFREEKENSKPKAQYGLYKSEKQTWLQKKCSHECSVSIEKEINKNFPHVTTMVLCLIFKNSFL